MLVGWMLEGCDAAKMKGRLHEIKILSNEEMYRRRDEVMKRWMER